MAITAAAFRKHLLGLTAVSFAALTAVIGSASQARADIIEDTAGFFGGIVGTVFGAPTGAAVSTLGDAPRAMYNKDAGAWEVIKDNTKAAARGNHNKNLVSPPTTTAKPAGKKAPTKTTIRATSKEDAEGRAQEQMYLDAQAARAAGNADPIYEKPYTYGASAGGAVTYVGGGMVGGGVGTIAGAGKGFVQGLVDPDMPVIGAVPGFFKGAWNGMLTGAEVGSTGTDGFPSFGFSSSSSAQVQPAAGATAKPIDIHPPKAKPASAKAKAKASIQDSAAPAASGKVAPKKAAPTAAPKKAEPKSTYTAEQLPPPAATPATVEPAKPAPQGPAAQTPAAEQPAAQTPATEQPTTSPAQASAPASQPTASQPTPAQTAPASTTADPAAPQLSGTPGDASVAPAKPVAGEPNKNGDASTKDDVPVLGETTLTSAPVVDTSSQKPAEEVKPSEPAADADKQDESAWSPSKLLDSASETASSLLDNPKTYFYGAAGGILMLCGAALYLVRRFSNKPEADSAVERGFAINKTTVTDKAPTAWNKLKGLVSKKPDAMMSGLAQELAALREERAAWQDANEQMKLQFMEQFNQQQSFLAELQEKIQTLIAEKTALAEENAQLRAGGQVAAPVVAVAKKPEQVVVAEEAAKPVVAVDFSKPVSTTATGPVAVVEPDAVIDIADAISSAVVESTGGGKKPEASVPKAAGGAAPRSFRDGADQAIAGKKRVRHTGSGKGTDRTDGPRRNFRQPQPRWTQRHDYR